MFRESTSRVLLTVIAGTTMVLSSPAQAGQANVDCDQKPNHPQCQPGNESQQVTPARITYATGAGHDIEGDTGTGIYEGLNSPDGLEVFIGSQANSGNIFLRQQDPSIDNRALRINIPANECGLPEVAAYFPLRFANAKPDNVIPDGVFGIAENESSGAIPMKIMFLDGANEYFINFDPSLPGPCNGQSGYVKVERLPDVGGKGRWTVSPNGNACIEKQQKGKNKRCAGLVPMSFSFNLDEL